MFKILYVACDDEVQSVAIGALHLQTVFKVSPIPVIFPQNMISVLFLRLFLHLIH